MIDQNIRLQETALRVADCDIVQTEKVSGNTRDGPRAYDDGLPRR